MVSIKRKVTIKTKAAQEETPAAVDSSVVTLKRKQPEVANDTEKMEPKTVTPPSPMSEKESNTGKIVGGIAAAAAILAGVYFFGIKSDDNTVGDDGNPSTEQIAQTGNSAQPEDASQTNVSEEGNTEDGNTVVNDSENKTSDTPAKPGNVKPTVSAKSDNKSPDKPSAKATSDTKVVQQVQTKQSAATNTNIAASSPIGGDVVENAKRVIRGDFGNGQERKDKLGSAYSEIQRKVNEMYRQGLVY